MKIVGTIERMGCHLVSLRDLMKLLKEIGFLRAAKFISFLAWFILPFWIWMIVLQYVETKYFVLAPAIPGLAILVFNMFLAAILVPSIMNLGFKVMKSIEKASTSLFRDPTNKEKVEQFKDECRKLAFTYTHSMPFAESGTGEYIRKHTFKLMMESVMQIYFAYSMITFFVVFQTEIQNFLEPLVSGSVQLIQSSPLPNLMDWSTGNLWITLGILWVLSLYYDPVFSGVRKLSHEEFRIIIVYLAYIFSLSYRILVPIMESVSRAFNLYKQGKRARCTPFVDPLTLPQIVQTTVRNVEGKSCDTLRWGEMPTTKAEIEGRKRLILNDKNMPWLVKIFVRLSRSEEVFRKIQEMRPITYIGIQNSRCVFFGTVIYDPDEKVRQAKFFFDTTYLKKEFLLIYEKEAEIQRQISRKIPSALEEIVERLKID